MERSQAIICGTPSPLFLTKKKKNLICGTPSPPFLTKKKKI